MPAGRPTAGARRWGDRRTWTVGLSVGAVIVVAATTGVVVLGAGWFADAETGLGGQAIQPIQPIPTSAPSPATDGADSAPAATPADLALAARIITNDVALPFDYDFLGGVQVPDIGGVAGVVLAMGSDRPFTGTIRTPNLTSAIDAVTGEVIELEQTVEYVLDGATQFVAFVDFRREEVRAIDPMEGDIIGFIEGSAAGPPASGELAIVSRTVVSEIRRDGLDRPYERHEQ